MKNKQLALLPWMALAMTAGVAFADSAVITTNAVTYLDANASIIWRTITESPAKIALDWPKAAEKAVLTIQIDSYAPQTATITDTTLTSYSIAFVMPTAHENRSIVTLSISYQDSENAELSSSTVRLGLVDGIGQGVAIPVTLDDSNSKWRRYRKREVVQIPPDATSVTLDGVPVDCDIPGWYNLESSTGEHIVGLTTATGTSNVTVVNSGSGLIIIFK